MADTLFPPSSSAIDLQRRRLLQQALGLSALLTAPPALADLDFAVHPARLPASRGMRVQILSLQAQTLLPKVRRPRGENESILAFAADEIGYRQWQLWQALRSALWQLEDDRFAPDVTFFTAPEFYWNIPWSVLRSKAELHQLCAFYRDTMPQQIQQLIKRFPLARCGKLVLLAGTNASLVPSKKSADRYEALNQVLVTNNFQRSAVQREPVLWAWPKRSNAGIDFLGLSSDVALEADNETIVFTFQLSEQVNIEVYEQNSVVAGQYNKAGVVSPFNNALLPALPFGIDICADFGLTRLQELKRPDVKLDFLLASGFPVEQGSVLPVTVQYLVRNDGKQFPPHTRIPQCEVLRVVDGKTADPVPGRWLQKQVWLSQLEMT